MKDSYESLFTVFLFGKPSITLSTPLNNASFNACSLYSPSTFAWKVGQEFDNNEVQIFLEQHYQHFVVNVPGTSTETVIPSPMWKRILSILGNPGGRLKWEVFGCRVKTGCISVSEYRIISIEASQPIQNPKISPTSKNPIPTLSWQGNCNTKFKVWFGNDGNFSKKTTYTFTIKNPNDNGGDFLKTVTPSQWKSIRRLVGDGTGSTIYWYVESWDGVGRYSKTNVMSFVLTE